MFDLYTSLQYFSIFVSILLFVLVVNQRPIKKANAIFAGMILALILWVGVLYFLPIVKEYNLLLLLGRLGFTFPMIFALLFIIFSTEFPIKNKFTNSVLVKIMIGLATIFIVLSLTPLIVQDVVVTEFMPRSITGSAYRIYSIAIVLILLTSFYILFKIQRNTNNISKKQIRLVILGFFISAVSSITTNLILPNISQARDSSRLLPVNLIFMLITVSYAILKFQFLDVRILIGRITYFSLLATILIIAYRITIGVDAVLWGGPYNLRALITAVPLALVVVLFYDSFKKFIQNKINSTLINPDFDPKEVISDFNNEISTLLSYEDIVDHTLITIGKTLRPRYKATIIKVKDNFELTDDLEKDKEFNTDFNKLLEIWRIVGVTPIILDELELEIPKDLRDYPDYIKELMNVMRSQEIKLILPISALNSTVGLLLIGQRDADEPYNSIQIDYLNSIANLAALALTRSFLYQEVREFNETLKRKVEIATQELARQNNKLQETLSNERDMLDVLGHELRTPLGIIRNSIGLFEINYKSNKLGSPEIDKFIHVAQNNIRREVQLLETILASAKIDNAKLDLSFEKVDATEIVNEAYEAYKYDSEKKGLKLILQLPREHLLVYADKLRLQQVLDNLVSNAIKYTMKGDVKIVLSDQGKFIKYSVSDTGLGIPAEDIPKLGQKFFRVNTHLDSGGRIGERKIVRPGGNGIGLYVVFQLVKYMGGEVTVESTVGKGTSFSFTVQKFTPEIDAQHGALEIKAPMDKMEEFKQRIEHGGVKSE